MATTGHRVETIVEHLARYAPTAECFAVGLAAAIDEPSVGLVAATQRRVPPDRIAAAAERYRLDGPSTAAILSASGTSTSQAMASLGELCAYDDVDVTSAWNGARQGRSIVVGIESSSAVTSIVGDEIGSAA